MLKEFWWNCIDLYNIFDSIAILWKNVFILKLFKIRKHVRRRKEKKNTKYLGKFLLHELLTSSLFTSSWDEKVSATHNTIIYRDMTSVLQGSP